MDKFIRIYGIASEKTRKLIASAPGEWPSHSGGCLLFVDYSDFDIVMGERFRYFIERELGITHPIEGQLVQVTQSFLKPFDAIPRGHKTICEIRFDAPTLELLRSKLPIVDAWDGDNRRFLLGTGPNY